MADVFTVDIPAGPIWNDDDAKEKAPVVAAAHGGNWNGQWTTVVEGAMSVVGVELPAPAGDGGGTEFTLDVPAGPIWNNEDAQEKGPVVAASYNGQWNGQWKTIVEGSMSVIGCTFRW